MYRLGFKAGDFPEAEQFHREIMSPIYPNLGVEAQNIVTTNLFKIFNKELPSMNKSCNSTVHLAGKIIRNGQPCFITF